MASKATLENQLRAEVMQVIIDALEAHFDVNAVVVGSGEIALPVTDAEGNEKYPKIKVSIPRGTRNGQGGYDPYDGYAAAEDYAQDLTDKAAKKAESEAKKQAKIAKDQAKRAEKAALAEANNGVKELRKIKVTPEE